ncbi:hypothetical protein, partial [Agrobacterium tumefaciens]|uniref:hypothetical protein n=1 Tax=Agrobacterium tumefaciens TaxID=358 RepID=UPI001AED7375
LINFPARRTIYVFANAAIIGSRAHKRKLINSLCESLVNGWRALGAHADCLRTHPANAGANARFRLIRRVDDARDRGNSSANPLPKIEPYRLNRLKRP